MDIETSRTSPDSGGGVTITLKNVFFFTKNLGRRGVHRAATYPACARFKFGDGRIGRSQVYTEIDHLL